MSIEATSSTISASTAKSSCNNSSSVKSRADSEMSFKNEMNNVSKTNDKKNNQEITDKNNNDSNNKTTKNNDKISSSKKNSKDLEINANQDIQNTMLNQFAFNNQMSMNDANIMLSSGIKQMIENTALVNQLNKSWSISFDSGKNTNISMNESDAEFFLNLTQIGEVSLNNINVQAQSMIESGQNSNEIMRNIQVSQTLLNALNESRQNNQPIRIDFDQNISVILRVNRDGAISANFIPSDKIAEQYLKTNIQELKNAFEEQNLPYTELSYSNSSKQQNKKRREQNQQGE